MHDRGLRCGPLLQLVGARGGHVEKVPLAPHLAGTRGRHRWESDDVAKGSGAARMCLLEMYANSANTYFLLCTV